MPEDPTVEKIKIMSEKETSSIISDQGSHLSDTILKNKIVIDERKKTKKKDVRPNYVKHQKEDVSSPQWRRHGKHFIILSQAGKPVFTRYGDENDINPLCGFLSVMISYMEQNNDELESIFSTLNPFAPTNKVNIMQEICSDGAATAILSGTSTRLSKKLKEKSQKTQRVRVVTKGGLSLVVISRTIECEEELKNQLNFIYEQIVFLISESFQDTLLKKSNFDMRETIKIARKSIYYLIHQMNYRMSYTLSSYYVMKCPAGLRKDIYEIFMRYKMDKMMYCVLFAGDRVVMIARSKQYKVHPEELLMLQNFVMTKISKDSPSLNAPICLPRISTTLFGSAYIRHIDLNITMVHVSSRLDAFQEVNMIHKCIIDEMKQTKALDRLVMHVKRSPNNSITSKKAELMHFLYHSRSRHQIVCSKFEKPYNTRNTAKRLIRIYKNLHFELDHLATASSTFNLTSALASGGSIKLGRFTQNESDCTYIHSTNCETIFVFRTEQLEVFAAFYPHVSKESIASTWQMIQSVLKKEEEDYFLSIGLF